MKLKWKCCRKMLFFLAVNLKHIRGDNILFSFPVSPMMLLIYYINLWWVAISQLWQIRIKSYQHCYVTIKYVVIFGKLKSWWRQRTMWWLEMGLQYQFGGCLPSALALHSLHMLIYCVWYLSWLEMEERRGEGWKKHLP